MMFAGLALLGSAVDAAPLYWDGDGSGAVGGGTGTWDATLTRWSTTSGGSTYQAWSNATNDDAVIQNTLGTVTLGVAISAKSVTFGVSGYTVGGARTLTLAATGTGSSIRGRLARPSRLPSRARWV